MKSSSEPKKSQTGDSKTIQAASDILSGSSKKSRFAKLLPFLGPAFIASVAYMDPGNFATNIQAGAQFGYSILIIFIFLTILLAVTQEMGIRVTMVTGKSLSDLIRERYGVIIAVFVFIGLAIANLGTIITDFAAIKAVFLMFKLPVVPLMLGVLLLSYLLVNKGSYRTNQRVFMLAILLYFAYIISAFKANPDWFKAVSSIFIPTNIKFSKDFVYAAIAIIGTTITPWGQFFVQSFTLDKKLSIDKLKYVQLETYFGGFLTTFFSFFIVVSTAATLFVNKIKLVSGEQAALAIQPFAGNFAGLLFGIGLINAGIMGIIIVSLTTAYAFSEFFGYEGSLDAPFERGKLFYNLFIIQLIIACIIVLLPGVSLFKIVFFTQALNALILPIIFYFLIQIANSQNLMGKYTNSLFHNIITISSSVVIVLAALFVLITSIFKIL